MYQTREKIQNLILIVTDFICLIASYVIGGYLWLGFIKGANSTALREDLYGDIGAILIAYAITMVFFNMYDNFMARGKLVEFISVCKMNLMIAAIIAVIIFFKHENQDLSRGVYIFMFFVDVVLMTFVHRIIKVYLIRFYKNSSKNAQLFLITTSDRAEAVIREMDRSSSWNNKISSMAIIDTDMTGQWIAGIPVVATFQDMIQYARVQVVDEVFINVAYDTGNSLTDIVMQFENMGATVHLNIEILEKFDSFSKSLNMLGNIPVVTFANNVYDYRKLAVKRMIDIVGSVVGMLITLLVTIFLAPVLLIESPGPLFFKQKRVGKNGRYFYIYKFRSMYADAEQRKAELMAKNEMNGLMFKMADDPRITKVGKFIRKTSIDELPQFFNVFMGDMSLVGTRPPTVDEFKQYATYHKRRLSTKPGITGLWQVSGRNEITNFEDVVKLDLEYIDNWTLSLDFKILFKTVAVLFKGK